CDACGDDPLELVPSPQFHAYVTMVPAESLEPLPLTTTAVPVCPVYGPPAFADGCRTSAADGVSPNPLYALTTTEWLPPEKGRAIEQPQVPEVPRGVRP